MQITAEINRIQKPSDLVNTALTEEQCIKTREEDQEKHILKPVTSVSNTLIF